MADIIAMFRRWAKSGLSAMFGRVSSSLDGSSSSSMEPTRHNATDDFQRIMRMVPKIEAVLEDAEEREIQDRYVNLWLSELRILAYDIDDVVDEYEYEVLRAQKDARAAEPKKGDDEHHDEDEEKEGRNISSSSSSEFPVVHDGIAEKLREIRERFDEIERDRKALRLREEDGARRVATTQMPRPTSSLVDESSIIGRENDKEKIINLLCSGSEPSNNIRASNKITVLPIFGMGGVGKTTLAQLIYNDPKIHHHFDLRAWIYVSDDFDLVRLTREIYRSITNKPYEEDVGFDYLQCSIKKEVMKFKRMFLVLDDVWNEEQRLWESLQVPFQGVDNVNILVTTRNEKVADVMRTMKYFPLGFLSEEEGRRLFQQRALCDDENLMKIGERIVKKCGGLPLAIKLLGSHLRFERDEYKWMSILDSELWDLDPGTNEILPALRLSYQRMPIYLKPCFRYCSMFPKNSIPDKNHLVWMWMAQGYIQTKVAGKTIEETGREYVDELLGRSFLQQMESKNLFKMHDLIFDLAVSISGKEFIRMNLEGGNTNIFISNNVRHLVVHDQSTDNEAQEETLLHPFPSRYVSLRSIFYYGRCIINDFQLLESIHLRALHIDIREYDSNMLKLIGSIATLKHLRYLYMGIAKGISNFGYYAYGKKPYLSLFKAFHSIHNLQVLDLVDCDKRIVLPESINCLFNLRHLILPYSNMSCGISKLTGLQTLKYVIVKDGSHKCGGLSEIGDLANLTRSCRISNISYATDVEGVNKANFNKKKYIWRLCLDWSFYYDGDFPFDVDIRFYDSDVEETESLDDSDEEEKQNLDDSDKEEKQNLDDSDEEEEQNLDDSDKEEEEQNLDDSDKEEESLEDSDEKEEQSFDDSEEEEQQNSDLAEAVLEALRPHNNLKELEIYGYPGIQFPLWLQGYNEWDGSCGVLDRYLPCLQSIFIISCAKLKNIKVVQSSSLKRLRVKDCPEITTLLGLYSLHGLEELKIEACHNLLISVEERLPSNLKSVCFKDCWKLTSITGLQNLHSLEKLKLKRCPKLQLSLDEQLSTIPSVVKFIDCPGLRDWCQKHGFEFIQNLSQDRGIEFIRLL